MKSKLVRLLALVNWQVVNRRILERLVSLVAIFISLKRMVRVKERSAKIFHQHFWRLYYIYPLYRYRYSRRKCLHIKYITSLLTLLSDFYLATAMVLFWTPMHTTVMENTFAEIKSLSISNIKNGKYINF